jgi:hypothetical protein
MVGVPDKEIISEKIKQETMEELAEYYKLNQTEI